MKNIFVILMMLVSPTVMAQNSASIVPSITLLLFDEPECFIVGEDVDCIASGRVRVPIANVIVDCNSASSGQIPFYIKYRDGGKLVEFFIGLNESPKIEGMLGWARELLLGLAVYFNTTYPGGSLTNGTIQNNTCTSPPVVHLNNFVAAGNEWKVTPVFSLNMGQVTLEELIFERQ